MKTISDFKIDKFSLNGERLDTCELTVYYDDGTFECACIEIEDALRILRLINKKLYDYAEKLMLSLI